jgi:hypothetical protein
MVWVASDDGDLNDRVEKSKFGRRLKRFCVLLVEDHYSFTITCEDRVLWQKL